MKKKVLKVVAGATLMVAVTVGMQMNKKSQEALLMLENLEAIAMASGESLPSDCEAVWDNVTCKSGGVTYSFAKKI